MHVGAFKSYYFSYSNVGIIRIKTLEKLCWALQQWRTIVRFLTPILLHLKVSCDNSRALPTVGVLAITQQTGQHEFGSLIYFNS